MTTSPAVRRNRSIAVLALVAPLAVLGLRSHLSHPAGPPGGPSASAGAAAPAGEALPLPRQGRSGRADGELPDGADVFDTGYPGVGNLDPDLLGALREAARDAGDDDVRIYVNSGWRSPAYQERLLDAAVGKYGSRTEAARWVATPSTSAHVSGDAVDLGGKDAVAWLGRHGAAYGLCRVYANEPWHYELRPDATHDGCPTPYTDPTQDPRMQP